MIDAALLACAINLAQGTDVHPETMRKIILGESGGNQFAINVNHWRGRQPRPTSLDEAIGAAKAFIAAGYNVDLGPTQINSRNLGSLHYTIEDAFVPCKNVAGGGAILTSFYGKAVAKYGDGQVALEAAISAYNTGNFYGGFENGYVSRIMGIPSVPFTISVQVAKSDAPRRTVRRADEDPYTASTAVFTNVGLAFRVD